MLDYRAGWAGENKCIEVLAGEMVTTWTNRFTVFFLAFTTSTTYLVQQVNSKVVLYGLHQYSKVIPVHNHYDPNVAIFIQRLLLLPYYTPLRHSITQVRTIFASYFDLKFIFVQLRAITIP